MTIVGGSVAATLVLSLLPWKANDVKNVDAGRAIEATVQTITDEVETESDESALEGAPSDDNPTKKNYVAANTAKAIRESGTNTDQPHPPEMVPSRPLILNVIKNSSRQVPLKSKEQTAEEACIEALQKAEMADGVNAPYTATCLFRLATLYIEQERLAEAEPLLRRALQIQLEAFGADHEESIATDAILQQTVKLQSRKWKAVPGKNGQMFIIRKH